MLERLIDIVGGAILVLLGLLVASLGCLGCWASFSAPSFLFGFLVFVICSIVLLAGIAIGLAGLKGLLR